MEHPIAMSRKHDHEITIKTCSCIHRSQLDFMYLYLVVLIYYWLKLVYQQFRFKTILEQSPTSNEIYDIYRLIVLPTDKII